MSRFRQEVDEGDGWTRWVRPIMQGYKMACCDCGLVHRLDFRVVQGEHGADRVEFRVRRDNRSTGQVRRHMHRDGAAL